jgi:hypothetical protein
MPAAKSSESSNCSDTHGYRFPKTSPPGYVGSVVSPSALWVLRMVDERFHRDDEGRPLREGRTPVEYLRAVATFARLDAIYGELIACVESGFRGERYGEPIDEATRDRLVAAAPRAAFAALQ